MCTTLDLAKKGVRRRSCGLGRLQGLKPDADLMGFFGPTEVVPSLQSSGSGGVREFFAACRAAGLKGIHLRRDPFEARLKPCPSKAKGVSRGRDVGRGQGRLSNGRDALPQLTARYARARFRFSIASSISAVFL